MNECRPSSPWMTAAQVPRFLVEMTLSDRGQDVCRCRVDLWV